MPSPPASAPLPAARSLGLWMCVALVAGNMIGSGIFLLPASLAPYGGLSLVGWGLSAGGSLLLALVFGRLARRIRGSGGPYAFARHGFGDFVGFLVAWGYWISILATNAAVAVAMVGYLSHFWPNLARDPALAAVVALVSIWGLTAVNCAGVRNGGRVQVVTTILKLAPLVLIVAFGLSHVERANLAVAETQEVSLSAISATVTLTLWAFLGLESATIPAGSVRDAARTIPRATLIGTLLVAVVYVLSTVAVQGVVAPAELASSTAPFAEAGRIVLGDWAAAFMAAGAAISCFGALNGWILLQGQIPLAAARDGLFPGPFARVSDNGTPVVGLLLSSALVTLLMLANYTRSLVELFTFVILLATLSALVPYVFATLTELRGVLGARATTPPGKFWNSVLVALGALLFALFAIAGSGWEALSWGSALLLAGVPVYLGVRRLRARAH